MSHESTRSASAPSRLAALLETVPAGVRGSLLMSVASFRPNATLETSFAVGEFRAAFAAYWEARFGDPLPIAALRAALDPPLPVRTVIEFNKFALPRNTAEIDLYLATLLEHLADRVRTLDRSSQRALFSTGDAPRPTEASKPAGGAVVGDLSQLVAAGRRFPTVYADPPWQYDNEASRAAAVNHYSTMTLDAICAEPIPELAADNAHLHLWTTNGFLREAFEVIDAWGFRFKSCLVWTKPEIGMGNYWCPGSA